MRHGPFQAKPSSDADDDVRRVAVVGTTQVEEFLDALATGAGPRLIVDILTTRTVLADRRPCTPSNLEVRSLVVPALEYVSRGDLIARYDAVVYGGGPINGRPLTLPGASLPGNIDASELSRRTGVERSWQVAVVLGAGICALWAMRALAKIDGGGRDREIIAVGSSPQPPTRVEVPPGQFNRTRITALPHHFVVAVSGECGVEAVHLRTPDGRIESWMAQLVVNAAGTLPPIMTGLAVTPSGHLVHSAGVVPGSSHEFVLRFHDDAYFPALGEDPSQTAVAAKVLKQLSSAFRAPWSHLDPVDWLRVRESGLEVGAAFRLVEMAG